MNTFLRNSFLLTIVVVLVMACASNKRNKKEVTGFGKFYHNTTALYNGYFNAKEIVKESYMILQNAHYDDYTKLLPLYDYVNISNPKLVSSNLSKAIEKVTEVSLIHHPSHWVDDCYVLMAEAQYLMQDYEKAEETLLYFREEFDPANPFGRAHVKNNLSRKQLKKLEDKERKEKKKMKEEERKEKEERKEEERKEKEKIKKELEEERKKDREQKQKDREEEQKRRKKEREKEKKERKKTNNKRKSSKSKKQRPPKKDNDVENIKKSDIQKDSIQSEELRLDYKKINEPSISEPNIAITEDVEKEEENLLDSDQDENDKKKKQKDNTAYRNGLLWLAKTYVMRKNYGQASYILRKLEQSESLDQRIGREIPVIQADIFIREKRNEEALQQLELAIAMSKKKRNKARYAFVAGQLSLLVNQNNKAIEYFDKTAKWSNILQMEMMAELLKQKAQIQNGTQSDQELITSINKMIGEKKYEAFRDQLYFTLGQINIENGDESQAKKSFKESNRYNQNNIALKIESYQSIAQIEYDLEDYPESKFNYDSTLVLLQKTDMRYGKTKKLVENLTEVAVLINTIELHDSMLMLSNLDEDSLREIAKNYLKNKGKEEKKIASSTRPSNIFSSAKSMFNKSSFWAYDPKKVKTNKLEFQEIWGDISLSDDWRRSAINNAFPIGDSININSDQNDKSKEDAEIEATLKMIRKDLPHGVKEKALLNNKIAKAKYTLGILFRDKFDNYHKAIETHEEIVQRWPSYELTLEILYYLYLNYTDINDNSKALKTKNRIIVEYPDSRYAQLLSDPSYASRLQKSFEELEEDYKSNYQLFEKGEYQSVYTNTLNIEDKIGKEHILLPKYLLLHAMAIGSIKGKKDYINSLKSLIRKHPNSTEKSKAEEILRFLQGDSSAFDIVKMEEVDDIFSFEEKSTHYIAIVMYGVTPLVFDQSKIMISGFNKKNFPKDRLQLSESELNVEKKDKVILVRKFQDKEDAMTYYHRLNTKINQLLSSEKGFTIYAITQRNFRKMVIDGSDKRYRVFFNKYYIPR